MDKVTAIIPTFNRFHCLMNTIESIKRQTYSNIEIIVINDCSTQKDYYECNWDSLGVIILHLEKNSKEIFGFACAGYVRSKGIDISTGKYIAFCDDDDIWFPTKIELQINAMKETGCKMSSTDGLIGYGMYDVNKKYKIYNAEHYYPTIKNIYKNKGGSMFLKYGFPKIWNFNFLQIHNCVIASSAVVEKDILITHQCVKNEPNGSGDDYRIWLRVLHHTNSVYVNEICFYYDNAHGQSI